MASEEDRQIKHAYLRKLVFSSLSDINMDWRRLLFESVSSKGMHRWMADRQWLLPGMENALVELNSSPLPAIISNELEAFLTRMARKGMNFEQTLRDAVKGMA
jgi:hypothetical protein